MIQRAQNQRVRSKLLAAALGALAATAVLVPTSIGETLAQSLLGPGLVRAEVVAKHDGAIQVYRIDRGKIRAFDRSSITLRELDGTMVVVPITPGTLFEVNGRKIRFRALRLGMTATSTRVGDAAAARVELTPPR